MSLPPGQHAIDEFPRFGTHLQQPPPRIPTNPAIEIAGAVTEPIHFPLADLANLPRRELTADFHCVAGWSATGLRWEGVAFQTFYREVIEPSIHPGAKITHVVFGGLDRYRAVVTIEDALADDVLLAEHLDGHPLDSDHGAPLRLVSPKQYGFINTKHLCLIELHTDEPTETYSHLAWWGQAFLRGPAKPHPRARVWEEERHRIIPGWALRLPNRLLIKPFAALSRRGSRNGS